MTRVVLSRRNLLTLLSKLDRVRNGEESARTIIKGGLLNPDAIEVVAEEDEVHYKNRPPGPVLPADEPQGRMK